MTIYTFSLLDNNQVLSFSSADVLTFDGGIAASEVEIDRSASDKTYFTSGGKRIEIPGSFWVLGINNFTFSGGGNFIFGDGTAGSSKDASPQTITGASGGDYIYGCIEGDVLNGGMGNDLIKGDDGNDVLIGGMGNDTLDGGMQAWADCADYRDEKTFVAVDLSLGKAEGSSIGTDKLIDIENIYGSEYDDLIVGDDLDNSILGYGGNDTLDGGDGEDTLMYFSSIKALKIDLSKGEVTGGAGNDIIKNFENAGGSEGDDVIIGDAGDNTLSGEEGNDTLDGGDGDDTVDYWGVSGGISADLQTGLVSGAAGNDRISNFENITGYVYADSLVGDANGNNLNGDDGNDTLVGADGDDWLSPGAGDDIVAGDSRLSPLGLYVAPIQNWGDTVSYAGESAGIIANLTTGACQGSSTGNDTLVDIENIWGTKYDDVIVGSSQKNTIYGNTGNDTLDGGDGKDSLTYGGAGFAVRIDLSQGLVTAANKSDIVSNFENATGSDYDDLIIGDGEDNALSGNGGNDTLDGGEGDDTVDYWGVTGGVSVNLETGKVIGAAGNDEIFNFENVAGYLYNDNLTGNDSDNSMSGDAGNDSVVGSAGDDWLTGGDGDDTILGGDDDDWLTGGAGNDVLDGGKQSWADTVNYVDETSGISADLATGVATGSDSGTDKLIGIENVRGTEYGDFIYGSSGSNSLDGKAGNDLLNGLAGADELWGGSGDDTLEGGTGNDELDGEAGNDSMIGGAGNDIYMVDSPQDSTTELVDTKKIKYGIDTVKTALTSWTLADNVEILQYTVTAEGNGAASDFIGVGNTLANQIIGGDSNDKLIGIDGDDKLYGLFGNDTLDGGTGKDILNGADGDDRLLGGAGTDNLIGGNGIDTFVFDAVATAKVVDAIADFTTDDILEISISVFTKLATHTADNLAIDKKKVDLDPDDYLIYNSKTGKLYYDEDGSGAAFKAIQIAGIKGTGAKALSIDDFSFV